MPAATGALVEHPSYQALNQAVRQAGLFRKRPGYYTLKIGTNLALLAVAGGTMWWLGNSWWQLVVAAGVALVFAQLAFIGHDAGHGQVCATKRGNDLVGVVHANLLTGFSYGWWLTKHNTHHAHCNRAGKDPDIGPGPVAFTERDVANRRRVGRFLARGQAGYFVPLLAFEALNLHVASIRALPQRSRSSALIEAALLVAHAVIYVGFLWTVMSPLHLVVFIVLNQGLFGLYLGMTFVTNHTGMLVLDEAADLSYLQRQVLTSRNVSTGRIGGFVYGGLHLQIEHHLFPKMPRANLRKTQPVVRAFCRKHGIPYSEQSIFRAYREIFRHLHHVGGPALQQF